MTTAIDQASREELHDAIEEAILPENLDHSAELTVREGPQDANVVYRNLQWADALAKLDYVELVTDEAMQFYNEEHAPGIHVGYGFELTLRDGELTALGKLHPAIVDYRGRHAGTIDDEVLAHAEVKIRYHSQRTAQLVRAYVHHHISQAELADPRLETNRLLPDGNLPVDLNWNAAYDVLVDTDEHSPPVQASWLEALLMGTDDIRPTLVDGYTEINTGPTGVTVGYMTSYHVDAAGVPKAVIRMHPMRETGFMSDLDLDLTIASATVAILPEDPHTAEAIRQYINRHISPPPAPVYGLSVVSDGLCRNCFSNQQDPVLACPDCRQTFCPSCYPPDQWSNDHKPHCPHCTGTNP